MLSRAIVLFLAAACSLACACGSTSDGGDPTTTPCTGPTCAASTEPCPDGFTRDAATSACMDVAPAEDCGPGTGAFLGATACKPVGWTSCTPPFAPDPSGWGCKELAPATCPAGTMATLGASTCTPVSDCSAPFPPANATMFVDATFATTDATHFTSLFEAAQSANSGAIIAVSPGTYVEDVDVLRSNVTIVGKCATEVIVKNPGDRRAGILVSNGAKNVTARGLTLTGHYSGMLVKAGSQGRLEESLVVKNRYLGAYVAEAGSKLTVVRTLIDDVVPDDVGKFGWGAAAQLGGSIELEDVVIHAPTGSGLVVGGAGSTGKVTRVAVRAPRPSSDGAASGVGVVDTGALDADGMLLEDLVGLGVTVSGGTLSARHVILRRTRALSTPETGVGLQISKAGKLDLADSRISASDDANVLVIGPGSTAKIATSVVGGDLGADGSRGNHGVRVAGGAALDISGSALVANTNVGLSVQDPSSTVTADGVLVEGTRPRTKGGDGYFGVGIGAAWGGTLLLSHASVTKNHAVGILVSQADDASGAVGHAEIATTLVRRTLPTAAGFAGRGIEVSAGGTATLDSSAITENDEASLLVGQPGSSLVAKRTLVRDTRLAGGAFGDGLVSSDGAVITLEEMWLVGHPGIAIAVAGGTATVAHSVIARCAIAMSVAGGTQLTTANEVPASAPPLACVVSNDTRFVDNQTRIGSGAVPLPAPLGDPTRSPPSP